MAYMNDEVVRQWLASLSNKTWHETPELLPGNEKPKYVTTWHLTFASKSLRVSLILLVLITLWVMYNVLVMVVKNLWRTHKALAMSLGLDQISLPKCRWCTKYFRTHEFSLSSADFNEMW